MHSTNVANGIQRSVLVAGSLITITALAACGLASGNPGTTSDSSATTPTSVSWRQSWKRGRGA